MLNLRNVTLAAALLLALAVGAYADPMSDTYEAGASVMAEVSNVRILEPDYDLSPVEPELVGENLVEGHSVFVTLEAIGVATPREGTVVVEGFVECEHEANASTSSFTIAGIPVPVLTSVNYVKARCEVYEGLIVTPTIYCQVTGDWQCDPASMSAAPVMVPTGNVAPFLAPDGQQAFIEELTFSATPEGESVPRSFYAYRVPILRPWIASDDGAVRNMQAPLPYDRLFEMDEWDFKFLHEDAVKRL